MIDRDEAGRCWVLWCGGLCGGNPHASKADAERWVDGMYASAKAAKQPIYGNYSIAEVAPRPLPRPRRRK